MAIKRSKTNSKKKKAEQSYSEIMTSCTLDSKGSYILDLEQKKCVNDKIYSEQPILRLDQEVSDECTSEV